MAKPDEGDNCRVRQSISTIGREFTIGDSLESQPVALARAAAASVGQRLQADRPSFGDVDPTFGHVERPRSRRDASFNFATLDAPTVLRDRAAVTQAALDRAVGVVVEGLRLVEGRTLTAEMIRERARNIVFALHGEGLIP